MTIGVVPNVIEEADAYTSAVAGVTVEAVRLGQGVSPNVVTGVPGERLTVTSSQYGFPMATHAQIAESHVLMAFLYEVSEGSRWCGTEPRRGSTVVYGPELEHLAVNQPGMRFAFAIAEVDRLRDVAAHLDTPLRPPARGRMVQFPASPLADRFGGELAAYLRSARRGGDLDRPGDDILRTMTAILAGQPSSGGLGRGRGIDSRTVVHRCIDHAEAVDRIVSIEELCRVAHVSERRLRTAFTEEFDKPPSEFMRTWALDRARRRLRDAPPGEQTVTSVAVGLGFNHLGRFASNYRRIFGESPSRTLRDRA